MSDAPKTTDGSVEIAAPEQLAEIIEMIEEIEGRKQDLADELKDAYAGVKGQGYDTKAVKRIISLRKQDKATRDEADAVLTSYLDALGMN